MYGLFLKNIQGTTITNAIQNNLRESNRRPKNYGELKAVILIIDE